MPPRESFFDRAKKRLRPYVGTVVVVAGVASGLYYAGAYALDRLRDIQDRAAEERRARESLRRRFIQNQEDCTFTLLALLPSLSAQILDDMDVEDLTAQLKSLKAAGSGSAKTSVSSSATSSSGLEDSVVSVASSAALSGSSSAEGKHRSEEEETPETGIAGSVTSSSAVDVGASWSSEFRDMESAKERGEEEQREDESQLSLGSIQSLPSTTSFPSAQFESPLPPVISLPPTSPPKQPELESQPQQPQQPQPPTQTKAQLWNQLKLLTFSRTLTTLYALVLLTLQTRIQLNLLGRHSYIRSVRELEREFAGEDAWFAEKRKPGDIAGGIDIDSETEMAYLTFSWWVMNVGWKAVSERVKMAVENVFSPVSLKKKLTSEELSVLLTEVRRQVEWDLGGDGVPRRHSFAPHLLPPTAVQETRLLTASHHASTTIAPDSPLRALLDETSAYLGSEPFAEILELSIGAAFATLIGALERKELLGDSLLSAAQLSEEQRFVEVKEGKRLAEVLGEVARWGRECLDSGAGGFGAGNEVVEGLADLPEMAAFSATIYSSFGIDESF